jgi:hypothetical protein
MRQLVANLFGLLSCSILFVLLYLCGLFPTVARCSAAQQVQPAVNPAAAQQDVVVARVENSEITKTQLKNRLLAASFPNEYTDYTTQSTPEDANSVLMQMIEEKAIAIQARKDNYLDDPLVKYAFKRFSDTALINTFIQTYLQGKVDVNDAEIAKKMQEEKGLDQAGAKAKLSVDKANEIMNQHYQQLYSKLNVKKLTENYPAVLQAYKRLNDTAQKRQTEKYISLGQVSGELTAQEKNTPLLTFDGGSVTLEDWFVALCGIYPANRPNFTEKPELVEALLQKIVSEQLPLIVSEAKSLGLNKNQTYQQQLTSYEEVLLLSKVQQDQYEKLEPPTQEQLLAYYNANKELFRQGRLLRVEQIWTKDMKDAELAKAEIDKGQSFSSVAEKYSISRAVTTIDATIISEGLFWNSLWKGQAGQVIGPVKGFYQQQVKYRVVKIIEKRPGQLTEYSPGMNELIINGIIREKLKSYFAGYGKELLKKYPYQIYSDRIKDIDPLDVP